MKTDSHVKIQSLSPLGDNHVEIVPGTAAAPLAPPGSFLIADPYIDFNALTAKLSDLAPDAQKLILSLNDRVGELKLTISRVNDLLNDQNRLNLSATIAETRGLLTDNREKVKLTIANLNAASEEDRPAAGQPESDLRSSQQNHRPCRFAGRPECSRHSPVGRRIEGCAGEDQWVGRRLEENPRCQRRQHRPDAG